MIWVGFDISSGILRRRRRPVRRLLPDAAQSLDPAGPDLLHRGHDDRHGADHRHAPDRSLGRLDARASSPSHRRAAGLRAGPGARRRPPGDLDHRRRLRASRSAPPSARFNGTLIAYSPIPSFIVTLGGLIAYRGAAFLHRRGETVAPMDKTFKLIGGNGPPGSIGAVWSWMLGAHRLRRHRARASCDGRRQRKRFNFPLRPIWAEVTARRHRLRRGARHHLGRQLLSLAAEGRRELRRENNIAIPPGVEDRPAAHLHGRRQGGALRRRPHLLHRLSPSRC